MEDAKEKEILEKIHLIITFTAIYIFFYDKGVAPITQPIPQDSHSPVGLLITDK